jgi:hypothetical protein
MALFQKRVPQIFNSCTIKTVLLCLNIATKITDVLAYINNAGMLDE